MVYFQERHIKKQELLSPVSKQLPRGNEKKVVSYDPDAVWQPPEITGASLAALDDLMQDQPWLHPS